MVSPKDLTSQLSRIDASSFHDAQSRLDVLKEVRRLHNRLMTPAERVTTMMWTEPWTLIAVRVALDMELFSHLDRKQPMSSTQAAHGIGAEPLLVTRICRLLGTQDILRETDVDTYTNTEFSKALVCPKGLRTGFKHFEDIGIPQLAKAAEYLKRTNWQNPADTMNPPWNYIMDDGDGAEGGFWNWLKAHPQASKDFNCFLGSMRDSGFTAWCKVYPIQDRLLQGLDISKPLVVDVGGGNGTDLQSLYDTLPERHKDATLVLEEQAHIIGQVKQPNIQLQAHDFFQPQPAQLHGARAYMLGHILHDWPDTQAVEILRQLRNAMTPGYSRLILQESVISDRVVDVLPRAAAMDLNMMAHFAALERTEAQWEMLLKKAGLRVTEIFPPFSGTTGIIEAVVDV